LSFGRTLFGAVISLVKLPITYPVGLIDFGLLQINGKKKELKAIDFNVENFLKNIREMEV